MKRQTFNVLFFIRKTKLKKSGETPIMLRITIEGQLTELQLKRDVMPILWNQLGIRQAFDKPVVLIQEKGTPKIFDIAPLRYLEYSKEMKYHEVLESQKSLQEAIEATKAAEGDSGNINSIVKLMALSSPAIIPNLDNSNKEVLALDVMRSQMNDLKMMMEMMVHEGRKGISRRSSIAAIEYERIVNKLDKISSLKMDIEQADREYTKLMRDTEEIMMNCGGELDHRMFKYLMDKIYRQREEYFSTR